MKIDSNKIIERVQRAQPARLQGVESYAGLGADSVQLSSRAADMRAAMEALQAAPAVREDRVRELREQLEQGTFDPSVDALAAKLLPSKDG